MRRLLSRATRAAAAVAFLLPFAADAQSGQSSHKALVYCPVSIDAVGCSNIASALAAQYSAGVDRGYDGSSGTVNLRTVDLSQYEVFLVPSLADNADTKPYALLRDAAVSERLHAALTGRIALWSGTPDLGTAESPNRAQKNTLIGNLATWAGATYATAHGPGLVAFLDQSEGASDRYTWLQDIVRLNVRADPNTTVYASVSALTATGTEILTSGGSPIAYPNMAAFGFQAPDGSAGISIDAVGQTGSEQGQIVLLTSQGGGTEPQPVTFFVGAHEDDWQLFMGEHAYAGIRSGAPVVLVYATAGDAGKPEAYWKTREGAADASANWALGNQAPWACGSLTIGTHAIRRCTKSNIVSYFLRLPDGGINGNGFGRGSIEALRDFNVATNALDFSTSYTSWSDFTTTIRGIIDHESTILNAARVDVHSQDYNQSLNPGDHADHWAIGEAVQTASAGKNWNLVWYADYDIQNRPANLSAEDAAIKHAQFKAYDDVMAASGLEQSWIENPSYAAWLQRSYFRTVGPVGQPPAIATGLTAQAVSGGQIRLQWTDNAVNELGFRIERAPDTGNQPGSYAEIASTSANVTTYSDVGLSPNTKYWYRVVAVNASGSAAPSNAASATTLAITPQPVTFFIGGHEDDWHLFMGERAYASIRTTAPVVLVYVTAGDAGRGSDYWLRRESAADAAANFALGNQAAWSCASVTVEAHAIRRCDKANVVSYFLRLPDGGGDGNGYGFGSLERLQDGTPTRALDNSTTYASWNDFTTTIRGIIDREGVLLNASRIDVHSNDYDQTLDPGDHLDHYATGTAVLAASSGKSWTLTWYVAFDTRNRPINLSQADQTIKHDQFKAYDDVMSAPGSAQDPSWIDHPLYVAWLQRSYFRGGAPVTEPPVAPTGLVAQATSSSQVTLQWTDNATNESGFRVDRAPNTGNQAGAYTEIASISANVSAFTDAGLSAGTTYWYRVRAYNAAGTSAPSNEASATTALACVAPAISSQPTSITRTIGQSASFSVVAGGSAPLTYTWRKNTTVIGGASGSNYSILAVGAGDAGSYDVVVSNSCGSVTSTAATLTINKYVPVFSGLTAPVTITYGTTSVTVGGAIGVAGHFPSGNVSVTLGASTTLAPINASTGAFTATLATSALPYSTTPYTVSYSYAGNADFESASNSTSTTITVTRAAATIAITDPQATYDGTAKTPTISAQGVNGAALPASSYAVSYSFGGTEVSEAKAAGAYVVAVAMVDPNYTGTQSGTLTIAKRALAVTAAARTKTYGDTDPALTYQVTSGSLVTGDAITGGLARNAGEAVAGSPYAITQGTLTAGPNYQLGFVGASLTITRRPVTVTTLAASDKTYDRTTTATITGSTLSGIVNEDVVGLTIGAATFADKKVGTGKPVTATGLSLGGAGADNYVLSATTATTSATINARPLTVAAAGVDKQYDGTTAATVTLSDNRLAGDVLSATYASAAFANASAGTGKAVTVSGISLTGADAGNYAPNATASTTANIARKTLTGSITANDKTYDGTTTATAAALPLVGVIAGDVVTLNVSNAQFDSKSAGNRTVSAAIALGSAGASNYVLSSATATAPAKILARALQVSATGANKVYDGNTTATVTLADNRLAGDVLTVAYASATFADKNVGTGKAISVTGITASGADAGNYLANGTASATASITAKSLTGSFTAVNRAYDGTRVAAVGTRSLPGVIGTDEVTLDVTNAQFDTKNIGTAKPVAATLGLTGSAAGNYQLTSTVGSATANITARALVVGATGVNKVYDGTTAAVVTLTDNRVTGDVLTTSYTSATFADRNVGAGKPVAVSGIALSGTDAGNYTFNPTASTTASITAKSLTGGITASDKMYDGTTTAVAAAKPLTGAVSGDDVSLSVANARFASKAVGTWAVTADIHLAGSAAGNYALTSSTATSSATITAKPLTGSFTAATKTYDGTTAATVATRSLPGAITGDAVTLDVTNPRFDTKAVGTAKSLSATFALSGNDAANYSVNAAGAGVGDITVRTLTVSATGASKVYDGTRQATVTLSDNRVAGDVLSAAYGSASFDDANVGINKTITVGGISISGADAANYVANAAATATGSITSKALTGAITASDKVYDGTRDAVAAGQPLSGAVAGDAVTLVVASPQFDSKTVGNRTVTASIQLAGAAAGNYQLTATTATTSAKITLKSLTGSFTANNKLYDGTTAATVASRSVAGAVTGDVISLDVSNAQFDTKNIGTGKTVSGVLALSGADAGNYTVNGTATTTAAVTAKTLTGVFTASSKVYDGTRAATIATQSLAGVVGTDAVELVLSNAQFDTKNAGHAKTVTAGMSLAGAGAGNYLLSSTSGTSTADVTARALAVAASGINKIYDGTANATVTLTDDRVAGDAVIAAYATALFADKNVGTGKAISVSGISLSGADAANYTANTTASATASITAKQVAGAIAASDKVYDGTRNAVAVGQPLTGAVAGDALTLVVASALFDSKTVGDRTVTASVQLAGAAAGNYTLTSATASAGAKITAKSLTGSFTANDKLYDGTTAATIANRVLTGAVNGDVVALDVSNAQFDTKNVGTGKTVSAVLALSGSDAANYTVNGAATTTAAITAKTLTGVFTAASKVYDGTRAATVGTLSLAGVIGTDAVELNAANAQFDTKNAGHAKTVTAALSLTGAAAGNYLLAATAGSTTADVTARALAVTGAGASKVYDGTTVATVTLSDNRLAGDVLTTTYTSASFATAAAGTNKAIMVSGITIAGADAANYAANGTASTAADITPKVVTGTISASDKAYDGTRDAVVLAQALGGVIAGDAVNVSVSGALFDSKAVGDRTVTASISLTGTAAGNYQLTSPTATAGARITPKSLVGSFTANDKVYDGTTTASVASRALPGIVSGDVVALDVANPRFDTKATGSGKAVTGLLSLSGADASNYGVNATAVTTASITAKALTVTATAQNKVYDGTTGASVSLADDRVSGDNISISYAAAAFADANAGTGKAVTVSGIALAGADAGNYTSNATAGAAADITPRAATVTVRNESRVYGQPNPSFSATIQGLVGTDALACEFSTTAAPASPVGTYDITATCSAANYTPTVVPGTLTIGKATPTITWNPTDITNPNALTATGQLNAVAYDLINQPISGTAVYSSGGTTVTAGTVLPPGLNTSLTVTFTPNGAAAANYTAATKTVTFNVLNAIDITPNVSANYVYLSSGATEITVAILGTATFDARTVVVSSLTPTLGNGTDPGARLNTNTNGTPKTVVIDINGDGKTDLLCYFKKSEVIAAGRLTTATTQLVLLGQTTAGRMIKGVDKVIVMP